MAAESEFYDNFTCYVADNKYVPQAQNEVCDITPGIGQNVTELVVSVMVRPAKNMFPTLRQVWHSFFTIVPTLFCFTIAFIAVQLLALNGKNSVRRFLLEFVIICVPVVLSVNVANDVVLYIVLVMSISLWLLIHRSKCFALAQMRSFDLGGRHPRLLTLARATINILTSVCILAIDFESFPRTFRKSRYYGAALMDVGIGLFIFAMGTVSRRPCRANDLRKLFKAVIPVLFLGIARTVVITYIGYHQDSHEYGVHLNAFFTLGLTKLFGTLLSAAASNDAQLLPMGLGLLILHEFALHFGVSIFVMNPEIERKTFLTSNREGVCSLPGFIAIYILSMYIGQWLQTHATLQYNEFMQKLKTLALTSVTVWILVILSIFTVGIARVTCNFGYSTWILAIAITMTTLYMFVFDFVLLTLWPDVSSSTVEVFGDVEETLQKPAVQKNNESKISLLPSLVEAVNRNGLTFFLLGNILTGGVNIFLSPGDRTDLESVLILSGYMLIATGSVYILHRLKIRIA